MKTTLEESKKWKQIITSEKLEMFLLSKWEKKLSDEQLSICQWFPSDCETALKNICCFCDWDIESYLRLIRWTRLWENGTLLYLWQTIMQKQSCRCYIDATFVETRQVIFLYKHFNKK